MLDRPAFGCRVQQPQQPMAQTHLRTGTDNLPILNQLAQTGTARRR